MPAQRTTSQPRPKGQDAEYQAPENQAPDYQAHYPVLGVRVPPSLLKLLDRAARAAGRTRSGHVRAVLEQSLQRPAAVPVDGAGS